MGASRRTAGRRAKSTLLKLPQTEELVTSSSPPAVRPRLPRPSTSFLGRDREVAGIRDLMLSDHVRLLTLVGPPGVGKTRLAVAVADDIRGEFEDDAVFVDLSPVRDPALVPLAVAQTLGITLTDDTPVPQRLVRFLHGWKLLLVLDNFEHVLGARTFVAEIIEGLDGLKIIATSREPLHLNGEREFPVAPLGIPSLDALPRVEDLIRYASLALLIERARAVRPDFALTPQNAKSVAEICVRLDGLPLAIEMAAARLKAFSPDMIAQRLDRALVVLAGARDAPGRHQTLRAALAWSYELLSPPEQAAFRRLSVFQRGCTAEAAQIACRVSGTEVLSFLDRLAALVDKSLLRQSTAADGTSRFIMLESLREFGHERLKAAEELDEARRLHATFFLELAERADSGLRGPEQETWFSRLEAEVGNFRAAFEWMLEVGQIEPAAELAYALHWFWYLQGYHPEARTWLARILRAGDRLPPIVRGRAQTAHAIFMWTRGDHDAAHRLLQEASDLFRAGEARGDLAWALHFYGHVLDSQGDAKAAAAAMEESVMRFRDVADDWGASLSLNCLGRPTILVDDRKRSIRVIEEAQVGFRRIGDRRMLAHNLRPLAYVLIEGGEYGRAVPLIEESVALCRRHGDRFGLVTALVVLAKALLRQGQYERTLIPCKEALILARDMGLAEEVTWALTALARVALSLGQTERAARLLGASSAMRLKDLVPDLTKLVEETTVAARRAYGAERFEDARRVGEALTLEEAVDEALSIEPRQTEERARIPGGLSPRERDVATLVAQGLSNREIGQALFIGHRTVGTHVQSILNKLGFDRRAQIAAWAASRDLSRPHS